MGIGQLGYCSCLKAVWEFQWEEVSPGVLHLVCSVVRSFREQWVVEKVQESGVVRASGVVVARGPRGKQSGSPYTRAHPDDRCALARLV